MSMELMVKAMKTKVGNPLRKLVLIKLADNANDQGECWPSYQHIADQCEIGRSTVKSHVRALEDMGMLRREFRRNGELNQSNMYRIFLSDKSSEGNSVSGAGADLGHDLPEVGQELSGGGAGADLGGGAGADPRTSHSFEPVNEPVNEPKLNGTQATASEPKKASKAQFSDDFESAWKAYPKRAGGNNKQTAWKAWSARIREGVTAADMHSGVQRYAAFITATGRTGTEYVKQAATFFGPDRHFSDSWTAPAPQPSRNTAMSNHHGFDQRDYGQTQTPDWYDGDQE
ncbi:UNVERIFIED_ORG: DNA-binding transcriptional ArsR family regulator [Pantoea agglomerans]